MTFANLVAAALGGKWEAWSDDRPDDLFSADAGRRVHVELLDGVVTMERMKRKAAAEMPSDRDAGAAVLRDLLTGLNGELYANRRSGSDTIRGALADESS